MSVISLTVCPVCNLDSDSITDFIKHLFSHLPEEAAPFSARTQSFPSAAGPQTGWLNLHRRCWCGLTFNENDIPDAFLNHIFNLMREVDGLERHIALGWLAKAGSM